MMQRFFPATLARDLPASIVVFLVAMPLCMGIAIASGAPPEKGLITGIIGGIVVGLLAGSPLQVSGPAAGLAVIVFELIRDAGIGALGPVLIMAGLIQMAAGMLKLGQWFRAISPAVVHGMLAGIGVLIVAGQLHVMLDAKPQAGGLANILAAPAAYFGLFPFSGDAAEAALGIGLLTITTMLVWEWVRPQRLRLVPGALVGVVAATLAATLLNLPVAKVAVPESLWAAIQPPDFANGFGLFEPKLIVMAVAIAFIASAETLLSAAAVDRMHDGVRTNYNRELTAQGVGNLLCGLAGALPMTGVIVRSSANVQAGGATRASTILHGVWILGAVALLPWLLRAIPMSALAGVLVVTGYRLVSVAHARHLFERYGALPAAIWAATLVTVVATDLLTGVLVGLGLSLIELLPQVRRLRLLVVTRERDAGEWEVVLSGSASLVQLPRLAKALESLPPAQRVTLRLRSLWFMDHTCAELVSGWMDRRRGQGERVVIDDGAVARHQEFAAKLQVSHG
ncbi:sulphate transporter [Nitrospirillum viridazoti Y2]|nr:SulP family inorganic anion transporter [Nitrospirillum amazonense]EGY00842.1 sulphate transporter [Nitrospirillum amazonense Y2]